MGGLWYEREVGGGFAHEHEHEGGECCGIFGHEGEGNGGL